MSEDARSVHSAAASRHSAAASRHSGAASQHSFGASVSLPASAQSRHSDAASRPNSQAGDTTLPSLGDVYPKAIREFNLKNLTDEDIYAIRGVICLPDDRILILKENKILVFDKYFCYRCALPVLECKEQGQGMTLVSSYVVAVLEKYHVNFFEVGTSNITRLTEREIPLTKEGHGIAFNGERFAVACDTKTKGGAFIQIMDKKGSVDCNIKTLEAFDVKLNISGYIAMQQGANHVYVSDSYHRRVVCISFEGNPIWEAQMSAHFIPYGLTLVNNEHLLSCAMGTETVERIVPGDPMKTKTVTKQVILAQPKFVAWQSRAQRLVIACYTVGNPFCTVVEF